MDIEIPDVVEHITAYRRWRMRSPGLLMSPIKLMVWRPRTPLEAKCKNLHTTQPCREVPSDSSENHMGEGCGFYSHKTFLHTLEEHLPGEAIGEVYAWGKVCPYECGYRSQFIQLSGIFDISGVDNTDSDYWATFADIYDVPLLTSPVEDYAQIIEIARWERCGWGMYGAMPLCEDPPEINLARAEELILNGEWPENE